LTLCCCPSLTMSEPRCGPEMHGVNAVPDVSQWSIHVPLNDTARR
jgi:hypothetical protein